MTMSPLSISAAQSKTLVSLYRALTRLAVKYDGAPSAKALLFRSALSPLSQTLPSSPPQSSSSSSSAPAMDLQALSLSASPSHPFASLPSDPLHVTLYYQSLLNSVLGGSRRFLYTPCASNASLRSVVQREFRGEHRLFSTNERLDAGFAALRTFSRCWHTHTEMQRERARETRRESAQGGERALRFLAVLEARLTERESERERERERGEGKESEGERVKDLEREREKERVWARALAQAVDDERAREETKDKDQTKDEDELLLLSHTLRPEQALQLIKRERARLDAHAQVQALRRESEEQSAEKAAPLLARLSVSLSVADNNNKEQPSLSPGVVLCAHPMVSGALHRSVILLLEHSSAASYGVVLNAPTQHKLRDAVKGLPNDMLRVFQQCDVYAGGPVRRLQWIHRERDGESVPIPFCSSATQTHTTETSQTTADGESVENKPPSSLLGSLPSLFSSSAKTNTNDVEAPLYAGGDISKILSLAKRDRRHVKDKFRFYVGCCCWGPGQLEREMQSGYWTAVQTQPDLLFRLTEKRPLSPIVVKSAEDAVDEDLDLDLDEDETVKPLVDVYELLHRSLGKEHAALAQIPEDVDIEQIDSVDWHA